MYKWHFLVEHNKQKIEDYTGEYVIIFNIFYIEHQMLYWCLNIYIFLSGFSKYMFYKLRNLDCITK